MTTALEDVGATVRGMAAAVAAARATTRTGRATLVAVTGIDGAGKGTEETATAHFPAQEIHLVRDAPRAAASAIVVNDPRLPSAAAATR